jgi:DNA-binding MarR family transcriptional regulator
MSERYAPEPAAPARAAARLARQVEAALGDLELSLAQYRLLTYLTLGETQPSQLAPRLGVTRPSVTALMDGLVSRGYVERQPDADDRRRIRHRVTPPGKRVLDAADATVQARLEEVAGYLSPADAKRALAGLALWNEAIVAAIAAAKRAAAERTAAQA